MASFNILGDVELVESCAKELEKKLKNYDFDLLVGPEVKVVPLIHKLSEKLKHKTYVICRKSVKPYMVSPIIIKPLAHFPKHVRPLVLDGRDAAKISDKKIFIIDDVVSTGVTMRMMNHLIEKVGGKVVGMAAILLQGDQFDKMENFVYLARLPIFKSTN